ncbi:MAG: VCBS repeat-containing protein [Deltaproteobacteria bacterium]|nr:VCBS repeat-containing protein [Deltaproteobacteria bacterium]MBW2400195.1 VCBS repeat-containing protein [Deltaproteobacteria bacterium]MBW2666449.1 VCBS repeat-containing protein [Deltaproteobacteria bacterium]
MKTRRILQLLACIATLVVLIFLLLPSLRRPEPPENEDEFVRAVCSSCHFFPEPGVLPRSVWRAQIEQMALLVGTLPAGSAVFDFDVEAFIAWYESRAPERLLMEQPITRVEPGPLRFARRSIRLGRASGSGVATVGRVGSQLVVPNMALGSIHLLSRATGPRLLAQEAGHPARVSVGDLDGNGLDDLVIADLGNMMPTDDPTGRVLAALQLQVGEYELRTLAHTIGRVADARPLDIDLDGDLDLVVAAFGYLLEGGVYVLRNESVADALAFRPERVTNRTGAVSVIPVDDLQPGTGPGFVVAFAQQHEMVSLFLPRESEGYEEHVLYRAPHPAWGTSNLSAADLDADGDIDFLLSNGDTLDDGVAIKPYHGVTWLENQGAEGFRAHPIGRLYGAHAAEAGDLDGDGDLDIVACGFLPQVELPVPANAIRLDTVVWFERDGDAWIPWEIESGHPRHTGVTLFDLDEDGRLDIVAAVNRAWDAAPVETGPSLEVWFNRGNAASTGSPRPSPSGRPRRP